MKRIVSSALLMMLCVSLLNMPLASAVGYGEELKNQPRKNYEQVFRDVPKDHWAFSYIAEMVDNGIISGYPDGLFRPDYLVKRAEFAKIMVNAAGLQVFATSASSFSAVTPQDWYCPFVEAAKSYLTGYAVGGKNLYLPETPALREDIAVALVTLKGYDTKVSDLGMLKAMFSDYTGISEVAKPYIAIAVEKGLISGYTDGTFRAQQSITRAEAAALLWRASQYGNDNKVIVWNTEKPTVTQPQVQPDSTVKQPPATLPEKEVIAPYTVDTISSNLGDVRSMVVDNRGVVHYVEESADYRPGCIKNSAGETIDAAKDLKYDLGYDDKNYDFSVSSICLAYDETADILYAIGFCKNGQNYYESLIVYDISDYDSPKMLINAANCPAIEALRFNYGMGWTPTSILGNGAIFLGITPSPTLMIDPKSKSVTGMRYSVSGDSYLTAKDKRITMSITWIETLMSCRSAEKTKRPSAWRVDSVIQTMRQ